MIANSSTSTA